MVEVDACLLHDYAWEDGCEGADDEESRDEGKGSEEGEGWAKDDLVFSWSCG